MTRQGAAACLSLLCACATVDARLGLHGGRHFEATVETTDGATITLHRWTPALDEPRRVLVVPELGFDHHLVAPLCAGLRDRGFDVLTFDPREVPDRRGTARGWVAWNLDVAAAQHAAQAPYILAIGVGGAAVFHVIRRTAVPVKGVLAINVPTRLRMGNVAAAEALFSGFSPRDWIADGTGALLLGSGRSTPAAAMAAFRHASVPVAPSLAREVAALFARGTELDLPAIPLRIIVGPKDNLVPPEDAVGARDLVPGTSTLRFSRLEYFARDYGHLDWLADPVSLADVREVIAAELEALP